MYNGWIENIIFQRGSSQSHFATSEIGSLKEEEREREGETLVNEINK